MLQIMNDPFHYILRTFEKRHPDKTNIVIQFSDELKDEEDKPAFGVTLFPDKGSMDPITIYLVHTLSIADAAEVLCHELAHAAVGYEEGHGDAWEVEFSALVEESQKLCRAAYEQSSFYDEEKYELKQV